MNYEQHVSQTYFILQEQQKVSSPDQVRHFKNKPTNFRVDEYFRQTALQTAIIDFDASENKPSHDRVSNHNGHTNFIQAPLHLILSCQIIMNISNDLQIYCYQAKVNQKINMLAALLLKSSKFFQISAQKYLRSISSTGLLYKPQNIRNLTPEQSTNDRLVQTFFDNSKFMISVSEGQDRLADVTKFSTPNHSYYQVKLPFKENLLLRKKMIQFTQNHVRGGRMLELMDYIAAMVAYRYCCPDSQKDLDMNSLKFITVTAAIDEIEFYHPISAEIDCTLSGYVSFVGKSSMEVQIDVVQNNDGQQRLACSAKFVMAARDKLMLKPYIVPPMNYSNQKQIFKIIYELGALRQKTRKLDASKALQFSPPSYEESAIIHKLIQDVNKSNSNVKMIPISTTIFRNTALMHFEERNLSGKIFGGFILRHAYELGWLCAYEFLKNRPFMINNVDDVQFLAPVEIGSYVDMESKVGYVTDKYLHIVITCRNFKFSGTSVLTNILRITFQHELSPDELRLVYPETLTDSYLYIESMRRVQKLNN